MAIEMPLGSTVNCSTTNDPACTIRLSKLRCIRCQEHRRCIIRMHRVCIRHIKEDMLKDSLVHIQIVGIIAIFCNSVRLYARRMAIIKYSKLSYVDVS